MLYKIQSLKVLVLLNQMHTIYFLIRGPKYKLELFLSMNLTNVQRV